MISAEHQIKQICSEWNSRKQQVTTEYEEILRDLQKSRVDGEEFIELRKNIEKLRPIQERRKILELTKREHVKKRKELIAEWEIKR